MSARPSERALFGDLPLFWKLLLPFLALLVVVGAAGTFVLVRDLSSRAHAALSQELVQRTIDARTSVRDAELDLVEAANIAANLEGMDAAAQRRDRAVVARLVRSVQALKTELDVLLVVDASGTPLTDDPRALATTPEVRAALESPGGQKSSGFAGTFLVVGAPVCAVGEGCRVVGAVLVGTEVARLTEADSAGVAVYASDGRRLAATAPVPSKFASSDLQQSTFVERVSSDVATVFAPLVVQERRVGTIAVTLPTGPAFASVRSAALRLTLMLLAAMVCVVVIGAALSRFLVSRVRGLVGTQRALARGDLGSRARIRGRDELGELADGLNAMAEQLQASYETLELRVAQRTEEVHRLLGERTAFFASVSHEFRTPLAVILRQVEMMGGRSRPSGDRTGRDAMRVLDAAARQLLGLVNDVLDIAHEDPHRIELSLEAVNVSEVIGELRPLLRGLAKGAGLDIEIVVRDDLPPVRADRARLRDMVVNLVDNAVKYTPDGGSISVSASARNGKVLVAVTDSGIGIPAEARDRIFEPFIRVEGRSPYRGQPSTGLGLAITKRLVDAHGGTIDFDSEPGRGTTFSLALPKAQT